MAEECIVDANYAVKVPEGWTQSKQLPDLCRCYDVQGFKTGESEPGQWVEVVMPVV